MKIQEAIGQVVIGHDLSEKDMYEVMLVIMSGDATPESRISKVWSARYFPSPVSGEAAY